MFTDRRNFLRQLGSCSVLAGTSLTPLMTPLTLAQSPARSRLRLLGTQGGPNFNLHNAEVASLLVVDGKPYLIDCGYGTLRGLLASGTSYLDIGHIFLSHLHDDHVSDLPALLSHQWTQGRIDPTEVYGPFGTDQLVTAALQFAQANTRIRMHDEARTLDPATVQHGTVITASNTPALVYQDDLLSVYAIENSHYPAESRNAIKDRSLAYRFDCPDRSIVFSGDTTYSDNLVSLASGADILVCEAMDQASIRATFDVMLAEGKYADNPEGIWHHIISTHTTTAQAGQMAAAAGVKTLVFTHLLPGGLDQTVKPQTYIDKAAEFFSGDIIVGVDQLEI